jgi:negative regulator of sigma E activity
MTDDERDELASAYLDGECTAEERRQVEEDPVLRARADELATVRAAVAAPVPAPPADRQEATIAAALTEFGRIHGTDAPASLTVARQARRTRPTWTRLAPLGAVAAVLVAVVGLAVALRDRDSGDDADDATAAAETDAEETATALAAEPPVETSLEVGGDDMADAARDEATTLSESAGEAAPEAGATGGAEGAATTAAAAETTAAPETTAAGQTDDGDQTLEHVCDPAVREIDPDLGDLVEVTDAEDGSGREVLVYVMADDPGARRSYEVDPPTCADIVLIEDQ